MKKHSFKLKISSNHMYIFFSFSTRSRDIVNMREKKKLNFRLVFIFFLFFLLLYVFQISGEKKNSFCYNVKIKNDLKKKWNALRNIFFCKLILRIKIMKQTNTHTHIPYHTTNQHKFHTIRRCIFLFLFFFSP